MRLTSRVRRLEAAERAKGCASCGDRTIGIVYDPPYPEGKPVPMGRVASLPMQCPACGRSPRIVLTMRPPAEAYL